jgi:hypothetical protein
MSDNFNLNCKCESVGVCSCEKCFGRAPDFLGMINALTLKCGLPVTPNQNLIYVLKSEGKLSNLPWQDQTRLNHVLRVVCNVKRNNPQFRYMDKIYVPSQDKFADVIQMFANYYSRESVQLKPMSLTNFHGYQLSITQLRERSSSSSSETETETELKYDSVEYFDRMIAKFNKLKQDAIIKQAAKKEQEAMAAIKEIIAKTGVSIETILRAL